MAEGYFVVVRSDQGTLLEGPLTHAELEKRLAEDYYARTKLARGFAMQEDELLVIRGEIVTSLEQLRGPTPNPEEHAREVFERVHGKRF